MRRQLPGEQEIGNLCLPALYRNSRNRRILFNYSLIKGKMRERRYDTNHEPAAHSPFPCVNPTERWGAKKSVFTAQKAFSRQDRKTGHGMDIALAASLLAQSLPYAFFFWSV